jgi:hypothetical protein
LLLLLLGPVELRLATRQWFSPEENAPPLVDRFEPLAGPVGLSLGLTL